MTKKITSQNKEKNKKESNSEKLRRKKILYLLIVMFCLTIGLFSLYEKDKFLPEKEKKFIVVEILSPNAFKILDGRTIKLICVEDVLPSQEKYDEAKNFLEKQILNKTIYLKRDVLDKDENGNYLRYVYYQDDLKKNKSIVFLNEEIIKRGFSNAVFIEPNTKYCEVINGKSRDE